MSAMPSDLEASEFHLASVAVEPDRRRQGLGLRLVRHIMTRARHRGCTRCRLEVRASNTAARALYEKLGFSDAGSVRHFYSRPREDAILLRADL